MRQLSLKTDITRYFPILDQLIQNAKSRSESERMILNVLRRSLPQDLSENQYKILISETVNFYENYKTKRGYPKERGARVKLFILEETLSRNYFTKGVFLDDIRNPNDVKEYLPEKEQIKYLSREWVIVRSFSEFKTYLENNDIPFFISLDHDLGCNQYNEENPSGYDACKWLANYLTDKNPLELHTVVCHSQNPIGKENIAYYWDNFLKSKNEYNMNQQQTQTLCNRLNNISDKFETTAHTGSYGLLKNDLKTDQFDEPSYYLELLEDLEEVKRRTRVLFIHTVLNKVCMEESKLYLFNSPYKESMTYLGVMKKESIFYLRDEDGDLREIFDSENFQQFVDEQYWEYYE